MTVKRQLESQDEPSSKTISEDANDWLFQFTKLFKLNFIDRTGNLPSATAPERVR